MDNPSPPLRIGHPIRLLVDRRAYSLDTELVARGIFVAGTLGTYHGPDPVPWLGRQGWHLMRPLDSEVLPGFPPVVIPVKLGEFEVVPDIRPLAARVARESQMRQDIKLVARNAAIGIVVAAILSALLAAVASCEPRERKKLTVGNISLTVAMYTGSSVPDLWATRTRQEAGGRELNPLPFMQGERGRIAAKSVAMVAETLVDLELQKRRSRWLWPFRGLAIGVNLAPGLIKVQHTQRGQQEQKSQSQR